MKLIVSRQALSLALENVLADQDYILDGLKDAGEPIYGECQIANQILHAIRLTLDNGGEVMIR